MHQDRRRGKGSRVLYWFRTPPGVKVGRAALDEDAIRLLEQINPDVEFDWTRMLKAEPLPLEKPVPSSSKGQHSQQKRRDVGQRHAQPRREREEERRPETREEVTAEPLAADEVIETAAIDTEAAIEAPSLMPSAAQTRLGTEGIVRLRGRYAEVLARIDERIPDDTRREELKLQAERLNPDSWVTDDEVRVGLEQYESAFESLRAVVGRRRKRRRRRGGRPQAVTPASGTEAQNVDEPPDEASDSGESDDL